MGIKGKSSLKFLNGKCKLQSAAGCTLGGFFWRAGWPLVSAGLIQGSWLLEDRALR